MNSLLFVSIFTFLIHFTESVSYSLRLSGVRTRQIAVAMSLVTSTLLVSRLSNMFQAPVLGAMVDTTIHAANSYALVELAASFRWIVFAASLGVLAGALLTPTFVQIFDAVIRRFHRNGSLPKSVLAVFLPRYWPKIPALLRWPRLSMLSDISWRRLPKTFLILNCLVASLYTIGVLCSLLAGAYLPHFRATAIQLSGIVNGIATILFTVMVDPSGARITDQAFHGKRPYSDVKSVVFFLLMGKLIGTLVLAQLFLMPFTWYIMEVTRWVAHFFG